MPFDIEIQIIRIYIKKIIRKVRLDIYLKIKIKLRCVHPLTILMIGRIAIQMRHYHMNLNTNMIFGSRKISEHNDDNDS